MNTKTCPDQESLRKLLLGELGGPQAEKLEEHLLDCDDCLAVADTISTSDELTAAFQSPDVSYGELAIVAQVIERGKQLLSQAETVETDEAITIDAAQQVEKTPDAPSVSDETNGDEEIDFLAQAEEADEIGRLGDYRVLEVLGIGGMGIVFRAEDPKLKREIALKAMKPAVAASKSAKDRFIREAQATAAIEHDNIVHIYQVGEDRNIPFIAMQFLRGESLQKRLEREKQLDQREVLRIGREVAAGLEAAHKRELVHRDIKPDNIWIEEETGRAKILDFGLVRTNTDDAGLTQSGMVLGTPRYMAPEQALGQSVDHRCDLFSLGSVLYHLATGKPPFEGGNLTATLLAVAHKEAVPIRKMCPKLNADLAKLIMRLLNKDVDRRLQSAVDVAQALAEIEKKWETEQTRLAEHENEGQALEETVTIAKPVPNPLQATSQPTSRKPILIGGSLATIAIGIVIVFWAAGIIFQVEMKDGTLVVKVTGDDFATSVRGKTVTIENAKTKNKVTIDLANPEQAKNLPPGEYKLLLTTESGLKARTDRFTIASGKNEQVEVWWEPKVTKVATSKGDATFSWPKDQPTPAIAPFTAEQAQQHQKAWADFLALPVTKKVTIGKGWDGEAMQLSFVLIPPGEFQMGSTEDEVARLLTEAKENDDEAAAKRIPREAPQHRVRITNAFYLGQHEMTQEQWQAIMGGSLPNPSQPRSFPRVDISWDGLQDLLAKLNNIEQGEPQFDLPTEAQWEYACRAGSTSPWFFGNQADTMTRFGWCSENAEGALHPVGQLNPNPLGLYDVYGNAEEWCSDWCAPEYYENSPIEDPTEQLRLSAYNKVVRGGSWNYEARNCRSAARWRQIHKRSFNSVGFRLAMTIDAAKPQAADPDR